MILFWATKNMTGVLEEIWAILMMKFVLIMVISY